MMRWVWLLLLFACSTPEQKPIIMECDTMSDILVDSAGGYARMLPPLLERTTVVVSPDSMTFQGAYQNTLYVHEFSGEPLSSQLVCFDKAGRAYYVIVSHEDLRYVMDVIYEGGGIFLGIYTIQ